MAIEVELKDGWTDYEGMCWTDVLNEGWKFTSLDRNGYVVMTRNGYINRFRNKVEQNGRGEHICKCPQCGNNMIGGDETEEERLCDKCSQLPPERHCDFEKYER